MLGSLEDNHESQESSDSSISMAALWIILAGQSIYNYVAEIPALSEIDRPGKPYHGPADESRHLAYNAYEVMRVIEESRKF
jgi:hypothetical protein